MKNDIFGMRRGPLASLLGGDIQWAAIGDCEVAESFADELMSPPAGICDLSALPRLGAKGECASIAPPPNCSAALADGALCCRLGADEILILLSPSGTNCEIDKAMMPSPRLLIPRRDSHCQIGLCGEGAREVLARLCAVAPPQKNELLQTRVADISAIVVSESRAHGGAFYLLADSGYAAHLWEETKNAAAKIGGGIVGWRQWRALFSQNESRSQAQKTAE